MKNISSFFGGFSLGLLGVFFLSGLVQYFFANFYIDGVVNLTFSWIGIATNISSQNALTPIANTIIVFGKIISLMLFIELLFGILRKSKIGVVRNSAIIAILFQTGFIIIYLFYEMIFYFVERSNGNIIEEIIQQWNLEGNQIYVLVLFVIMVLFTYLQTVQKRIMKYISVN